MEIKRIIPILTILNDDLVKTKFFNQTNLTYIGDILNAVRIFNDKNAEEIIINDIGATVNNKKPNFSLIKKISSISRMPISYGGGIKSLEDAKKILSYGIEKISISSALFENDNILEEFVSEIGSQSVSVTIDLKMINDDYFIFTNNGKTHKKVILNEFIKKISKFAGELVINSIDNDGTMNGPDERMISNIYKELKIPLVVTGGFGKIDDIINICNKYDIIGVACGSLFVYKGNNNAVLINYPIDEIRRKLDI